MALPLAAQAADYRVQLSESVNSGLAAAHPTLLLRADLDNADGGGLVPTGLVRFSVDTRHLSGSAWNRYMAASTGTQLGTITSDFTGPGASSLRVLGHGTDSTGAYVRAGVDVPSATAAIIGSDNLTVIIRRTTSGAHITYQLDWHAAAGKLAAKAVNSALHSVTLALRGAIVYSGAGHAITQNPSGQTAMTNSVVARACAQPACTTLRPANVTSSATVHLPKSVTLAAPVSALYGYRYSIGGTGRAGDAVSLESLATNGLVPARGATMVKPDGTFVIRATLRSAATPSPPSRAATPPSTASPARTRTSPSRSRTSCCSGRPAASSCTSPSASREPTSTCASRSSSAARRSRPATRRRAARSRRPS
jgi:hypothetical protein